MDEKTSARVKRASSQRGRARHSTRKHHPVLDQDQRAASNASQPTKVPGLPSNWKRYEEEEEEELSIRDDSLSQVPAAKSKGANYIDLLSEKAMYQASDLARRRKGLMASRGLDLWAQLSDVNNFWSTHASSGEEDSFFSLDLNILSEELAKIDMTERLLVDPKYIPHEERLKHKMQYKEWSSRTNNETDALEISSPLIVPASTSANKVGSQQSNPVLSGLKGPEATAEPTKSLLNHMPEASHSKSLSQSQEGVSKETTAELPKRTIMFEAKAAEAELDALLDMFDHKIAEDLSTLVTNNGLEPSKSFVSSSQGSHPDKFTKCSSKDLGVDLISKIRTIPIVPDVLSRVNMPPSGAVFANDIPPQTNSAGNLNCGGVLDDYLDDWLDSL